VQIIPAEEEADKRRAVDLRTEASRRLSICPERRTISARGNDVQGMDNARLPNQEPRRLVIIPTLTECISLMFGPVVTKILGAIGISAALALALAVKICFDHLRKNRLLVADIG
jgi:hypothetical protein